MARVRKTRQTCDFEGYKICLDEVKNLGSFMELEKMTDEPAEKVQKEMIKFLEQLGISKNDLVFKGYDTMVYLKNHDTTT